ncbi:MAG: methylenetetrahydrofolate--tRNA-(uracil(54)-C(5))-methyltransferase (FADH(2)-oxidizing) TrmFO [Christensenellales bacterium]|jgi:methylenetetrahydrofolate--tRNA-(uracil-5-)-methyltransferase
MQQQVKVIGAGLAGCEAAWQIARRHIPVRLYEMRPEKMTPAHSGGGFAELVCSNSLRSGRLENAVGLLKEEMRRLDSLIMRAADETRIPAGGALAVDREAFSRYVTGALRENPLVEIVRGEVTEIPEGPCIIATGPLTSDALAQAVADRFSAQYLSFYDAVAPIVTAQSLNMDIVFAASRYDRGEDDYLNCPMNEAEYHAFWEALTQADVVEPHSFEDFKVFEGCMPIEAMAERGLLTLAHGPMKPVGLTDPRTGKRPFAVVQLRQETKDKRLYNLVGFQTRMKHREQKRVLRMIPGLENAQFVRYGVMHRNTYLNAPALLNRHYQVNNDKSIFFAGQITGVEGYVESASSGLVAGRCMAAMLKKEPMPEFSQRTAIGALAHYVHSGNGRDFQPMNVNFGIMEPLRERIAGKKERYARIARRALEEIQSVQSR